MHLLTYFQNQDFSETEDNTDLKMILESIWKIRFFKKQFKCRAKPHSITNDDSLLPHDILRLSLITKLCVNPLQETEGVFDMLVYILETIPRWNIHFEVNEMVKKICKRCNMDTEYPVERSYGLIITANSIRETKAEFEKLTFEDIVKFIRINLKMPCDKEGCGNRSYVQRMINKLPIVFTIALEWDNNETEEEICDTTSVLVTEIDITAIYQYEGDSEFTKYRLVSMVCSCGDQYNCVAYESESVRKDKKENENESVWGEEEENESGGEEEKENKRWVRRFGSQNEDIGEWDDVLSMFRELNMRPEILFFENESKGAEEEEENYKLLFSKVYGSKSEYMEKCYGGGTPV